MASPTETRTKTGILLLNLGTPKSLELSDIKDYLDEFLNDPYVIDLPSPMRRLLVNGVILRTRPTKTQAAYKKIWTDKGSPLLQISLQQRDLLAKKLPIPVALGMRYQEPSIAQALNQLKMQGCTEVRCLPLYPQYALSSTETGIQKVKEEADLRKLKVSFVPEFYDHSGFISSHVNAIKEKLEGADALMLSFHGLPERHVKKTDACGGKYCLSKPDCCARINEFNSKCYRAQSYSTASHIIKELKWVHGKFFISFQSRLTQKWIRPFTDELLKELPSKGVKTLVVTCPSFVTDCLETLEEIGIRAKEDFISYGGTDLRLVPSLNTRTEWINTLVNLLEPSP
jgi:ferrochelatase